MSGDLFRSAWINSVYSEDSAAARRASSFEDAALSDGEGSSSDDEEKNGGSSDDDDVVVMEQQANEAPLFRDFGNGSIHNGNNRSIFTDVELEKDDTKSSTQSDETADDSYVIDQYLESASVVHHGPVGISFVEGSDGAVGILKKADAATLCSRAALESPGRRRRRRHLCNPNHSYLVCGAFLLTFIAFLVLGLALRMNNNNNSSSSSAGSEEQPISQSGTPQVYDPPDLVDQETKEDAVPPLDVVHHPLTKPPTPAPQQTPPPPVVNTFEPMGPLVFPPHHDGLPDNVRPRVLFGHVLATNAHGDKLVAGRLSHEPHHFYGGYEMLHYDTHVSNSNKRKWIWERFMYESPKTAPGSMAPQSVAMTANGDVVAFTQAGETFVCGHKWGHDELAAHTVIKQLTPAAGWNAASVAITLQGEAVAVLEVTNGNAPSKVLFYRQRHMSANDESPEYDFVSEIQLTPAVQHGSIAFGEDTHVVSVGTYDKNGQEELATYVDIAGTYETWSLLGDPQAVAASFFPSNLFLGGSVHSLSADGTVLAIGSRNGSSNRVVLLLLNTQIGEWEAFGTNHVLIGPSHYSHFGAAVQLSGDGTRLFVGAPGPPPDQQQQSVAIKGYIYAYAYDAALGSWFVMPDELHSDVPGDGFGSALATNIYGSRVITALPTRGQSAASGLKGAIQSFEVNF